MRGIFVYTFVISFVLGVALYSFFDFGLAFVCLLALLAFSFLLSGSRAFLIPTIVLLAFGFGALRMHVANTPAPIAPVWRSGEKVTITGTVITEPDERATHTNLSLQAPSGEKVLLRVGTYTDFAYGDQLRIVGKLQRPKSFTSKGGNGRIFNYPRYLAKDNIYYTMSYPKVEVLSRGNGNFIKSWLFGVKHKYISAVEIVVPEPASALAGGITVGAKMALGEGLTENFRKTGIIHIVVLSGYNVMIIASFILFIFSFLSKRVGAVVGAVLIVLFTIMVGGGATVMRASVMGLLSLFAVETGRTYSALRALAIVGLGMLLWNPKILIADVSFQLSFVATLGLIFGLHIFRQYSHPLLANTLDNHEEETETLHLNLKDILIATISTQVAVLPLILYYMGDFSIVAILVNLLVLPAVPFAMLAVFLTGVFGLISTALSLPFAWVSYILLEYILRVVDIFANLPFSAIHIPGFSFLWVVVAYTLLGGLIVASLYNTPIKI